MRQYYVPRDNVITFAMHMLNLIIITRDKDFISFSNLVHSPPVKQPEAKSSW